jgi:formiminotetrahydrofolate cyclodeaminase
MLTELTLGGFADEVAGLSPAPGGGSVAAYAGCQAAALVAMVCHLTIGKKGFEGAIDELQGMLSEAEELRVRLLAAVDEDTDAYLQVAAAYGLPKDTDEEKSVRQAAVSTAMLGAAEVPMMTARGCMQVLEIADKLSVRFNPATASDLGVAIQSAMCGVRGALLNVAINMPYLKGSSRAQGLSDETAEVKQRSSDLLAASWPRIESLIASQS